MNEQQSLPVEPYISSDEEWDEEGLTPRSLSKLRVQKKKHKTAYALQEAEQRKANRASNTVVWKKYSDAHEAVVFFPETAKIVAEMAKSKSKTLVYPNGTEYRGLTKGIKPEGEGTMQWPNGGGNYVGTWKIGLPHGQGRRVYANGESYVGRWKNGRRHGFGIMTNKSDQQVLYEGLWRDGTKAHQADYAAGLPSPDRKELHRSRVRFNTIGNISSAADLMVEKMISAPLETNSKDGPKYFGRREPKIGEKKKRTNNSSRKSSTSNGGGDSSRETNAMELPEDDGANVSAYYVKKEKLKNIQKAWYSYPSTSVTPPLRQIANAKIDVQIKSSYKNMIQKVSQDNKQLKLSMEATKSIYTRERKALMNDYQRGMELLHEKFSKQRRMTLKMGIMRGGIAIDRSVREVKKLKDQYIAKNEKMMERRQRCIVRMKEEYLNDVRELKGKTTNETIKNKQNYLATAWSRNALELVQERQDIERTFMEDRRIEQEQRQTLRIKAALSGQVQKRTQNFDGELEDNDGNKAKNLYLLSTLSKVLKPSLAQELSIAFHKWLAFNVFKSHTEDLRLDLVKLKKNGATGNSTTFKKKAVVVPLKKDPVVSDEKLS